MHMICLQHRLLEYECLTVDNLHDVTIKIENVAKI